MIIRPISTKLLLQKSFEVGNHAFHQQNKNYEKQGSFVFSDTEDSESREAAYPLHLSAKQATKKDYLSPKL